MERLTNPETLLALQFSGEGDLFAVRGARLTKDAYHLAVVIAQAAAEGAAVPIDTVQVIDVDDRATLKLPPATHSAGVEHSTSRDTVERDVSA